MESAENECRIAHKINPAEPIQDRKRVCDPSMWKTEQQKRKRNFYRRGTKLLQDAFILKYTACCTPQRNNSRAGCPPKSFTIKYYVTPFRENACVNVVQVCQDAFRFYEKGEFRGKVHLLAGGEPKQNREDSDISFGCPVTWACSFCIRLKEEIRHNHDQTSKQDLMTKYRVHKLKAKAFYEQLQKEKDDVVSFSFDCQKNQVLPKLSDQSSYYSRQLYCSNFTICQDTSFSKQDHHMKKEKLKDVESILCKHYGSEWRNIPLLDWYRYVLDNTIAGEAEDNEDNVMMTDDDLVAACIIHLSLEFLDYGKTPIPGIGLSPATMHLHCRSHVRESLESGFALMLSFLGSYGVGRWIGQMIVLAWDRGQPELIPVLLLLLIAVILSGGLTLLTDMLHEAFQRGNVHRVLVITVALTTVVHLYRSSRS
ncbi:hypothetical protein PR048_018435 [Dryococelus australis]|uniref:Uncharacterized protein n=1 Tax=Dryococelus australis TaxID=614101 RepID=A0ABQ9HD05_9NEOP|nr:hypothetical protein PR048_018435 [Dryococelus australis]